MKKIILSAFLVLVVHGWVSADFNQYNFPNGTSIGHQVNEWVVIIKPTEREIVFHEEWTTAQQLWFQHYASAVINAWYFGYSPTQKFMPAGIYTLWNDATTDVAIDPSHCARDGNLCSFLNVNSLGIHRRQEALRGEIINSGPILTMHGIINPDIYATYSHWQRKTYRTLVVNSRKWPLFVLTTKPYTLPEITHYLLDLFGHSVSIINLDGGSSTSLWTSQSGTYFNDDKLLPTYFIIH